MQGHPLEGWRFWRVFAVSGGVVVQTGAVDEPARLAPELGGEYGGGNNDVLRLWKSQMIDALDFSQGMQGSGSYDHINGEYNQSDKAEFLKLVQ